MSKLIPALGFALALSQPALADIVTITATTDYSVVELVAASIYTPLTFDLTTLPSNAIIQSASVLISFSTYATSDVVTFPNPITTWNEVDVIGLDPGPGFEQWDGSFQQSASLDTVPVSLNPLVPVAIAPQYITPGGSLNATLSLFGGNGVFFCDPDMNGDCNEGALEPDFGVMGEATGTLDINYSLPGELPEPSYILLTCLLSTAMIGRWRCQRR